MRHLIIASLLMLSAHSVSSEVIEQDLFASGDKLTTLDTSTGLLWLDLDTTIGLSYLNVLAGEGEWINNGWRYATGAEVTELLSAFGIDTSEDLAPPDQADIDNYNRFYEFFGETNRTSNFSFRFAGGLVGDQFDDVQNIYLLTARNSYSVQLSFDLSWADAGLTGSTRDDADTFDKGHWLVKPTLVPVPPALMLFISGLGLLLLRMQRKH